jgi:hypothetical protein
MNNRQRIYLDITLGTLIYAVSLGFFNDYTDIVSANSFSTIFFASIVLSVLTHLVFAFKKLVVKTLKPKQGSLYRLLTAFGVWLTMFLSKFLFIWALDFLFGEYIAINGFFGILLVVATVTIISKIAYLAFDFLGDKTPSHTPTNS